MLELECRDNNKDKDEDKRLKQVEVPARRQVHLDH